MDTSASSVQHVLHEYYLSVMWYGGAAFMPCSAHDIALGYVIWTMRLEYYYCTLEPPSVQVQLL